MPDSIVVAPEVPVLVVGETNICSVSFADVIGEGELLDGVPIVVEITTSHLTITNERVNTSVLIMGEHIVGVGKAVQFAVSGQNVAGSPYSLKITVTTDSAPVQTKVRGIDFTVENIT